MRGKVVRAIATGGCLSGGGGGAPENVKKYSGIQIPEGGKHDPGTFLIFHMKRYQALP
jgi:hypothetical protein